MSPPGDVSLATDLPGGTVIGKLYGFAKNIRAVATARDITLENAFYHPDVQALRINLVDLLAAADTASALIAAAQALRGELERTPHATDDDILKRGHLAGAAVALSELATVEAGKQLQIFVYSVRQVLPWLEGLFKLGVLVASAVL